MAAQAYIAAVESLANIAESVGNVVDTQKRREFEFKLTMLDVNEREALNKALKRQKSQESKEKILTEVLGSMNRDRINALVLKENEREKTLRYLYIFGGVAILTLVGIFVYVSKKGKK